MAVAVGVGWGGSAVTVRAAVGVFVDVVVSVGVEVGRGVCVSVGVGRGVAVGGTVAEGSAAGSAGAGSFCSALEIPAPGARSPMLGVSWQAESRRSAANTDGSEIRSIITEFTVLSQKERGLPARRRQFGKQAIPLSRKLQRRSRNGAEERDR